MSVEARVSRINPEITGLIPGLPQQTSPDLIRRNRFAVVPIGAILTQVSEITLPSINPENSKKLLQQEKPLHDQVGNKPYNPRKSKGYHDRYGRLILYRRGGGGGGRCARTNHEVLPCPTPERCKKSKTSLKPVAETRNNRSSTMVKNINTAPSQKRQSARNFEHPKTKAA